MKKILMGLVLAATMVISGCAATINGASQNVAVVSNQDDASLYVNDELVGKGSTNIHLKKKENYVLTARKEGCEDVTIKPTKSFDPTTLLGVFVDFGIISILVVDGAVTGAWNKFDQSTYFLNLDCQS